MRRGDHERPALQLHAEKEHNRCAAFFESVDGEGQKALHCVFEDLQKAYRMPREDLWYSMKKSGLAEKYARVVQDM